MTALRDLSTTMKRQKIHLYAMQKLAQVRGGQICSCHAMADIWGWATMFYKGWNNDEESYVEDVSLILAGVNEWCTTIDPNRVGAGEFTDSGFKGTLKNRYFRHPADSNPLIIQAPNLRKLYFSRCP